MPDALTKDIWTQAKAVLKDKLNPQSFNVWFVPTKPLSLDNNVLQIEVPNKFLKTGSRNTTATWYPKPLVLLPTQAWMLFMS